MPTKRSGKRPDVKAQIQTYLDAQPPAARRALRQLRATIRSVAPKAVDQFSYRMPGFRHGGKAFLWYAGFKAHVSLFPIGARVRAHAGADRVKGLGTSTGTIRFPLDQPLPLALVRRLVKARLAEMRAPRG